MPIAAIGGLYTGLGILAVFWAVTISNVAVAPGLAGYYYYATGDGMLRRAASHAVAD